MRLAMLNAMDRVVGPTSYMSFMHKACVCVNEVARWCCEAS